MLSDADYVDRALRLAERGLGRTSPNPVVGAVVVTFDGIVVGQGYHEQAGTPHAEVHALDTAGDRARGATLYCSLEPCSHHGRTGPCVERIVAAGVARVVAPLEDPNPRVSGEGFRYLRAHGISVDVGVRRDVASRLNRSFFTYIRARRPFVTMKIATSLDGRIAARPGIRTQLTSEVALQHVHYARACADAIGIGSESVLIDDPRLTVRNLWRAGPLRRVVFDRRLRISPAARLFSTLASGPVTILTTAEAVAARPDQAAALRAAGAEIEVTAGNLDSGLSALARIGVTSLVLEGGTELHRTAWTSGLVDCVQVYVAPVVLGAAGTPWLSESEFSLASLNNVKCRALGPDTLIEGDVHRTH